MPTIYKYKGAGGAYLNGVPARDLDADDLAALTPEQRAGVEHSTLYEAVETEPEPEVTP